MRATVKSGIKRFIKSDSLHFDAHSDVLNKQYYDYHHEECDEVEELYDSYPSNIHTGHVHGTTNYESYTDGNNTDGYESSSSIYSDDTPKNLPPITTSNPLQSSSNEFLNNKLFPENTTIIVDWDDTIFPSSQLSQLDLDIFSIGASKDLEDLYPELHKQMLELDIIASNFFSTSPESGMVIIVTNADRGWVELSCSEFLPFTWNILNDNGIMILSARHLYGSLAPCQPILWKYYTFLDVFRKMYPDKESKYLINCISIGDSDSEKLALFKSTALLSPYNIKPCAKSIKFIENPNIKYILLQLKLVTKQIKYIAGINGIFDWMMTFGDELDK